MMEYINKEKLIKSIEDKRPLNWNDTEAELAEQGAYDDIINLIKDFDEGPCIVSREEREEENETYRYRRSEYIFELNRSRND